MEKLTNNQFDLYVIKFKDTIKNKIKISSFQENENELINFIDQYPMYKDNLQKTKRIKIDIPIIDRCIGKRINGEQCTRRKRKECHYCGTHFNSIPYGIFEDLSKEKINIYSQDIKGIIYYIDKFMNVYNTEDIITGKEDPTIIAKANIKDGIYSIPELGL